MKRNILALLLCAALVLGLCGCGQPAAPTEPTAAPTTAPTEPPVSELYTQAKAPVLDAAALELAVTREKAITIGDETFQLDTVQIIRFAGLGTDGLQVAMTEELELDDSEDKFEEYYSGGTLYVTVYDEYKFKGAQDEADYLSRLVPGALLDEALYADITAAQDGENTVMLFNSPSAPESWALPEEAVFHSAKGSALIGSDGALLETAYTVSYTYGGSHITETITVVPTISETTTLAAPEDADYTELDDIEAIRLYDMAIMYLYATDAATTNLTETITSQAAAYVVTTQNTVNFHGAGSKHVSEVTYSISAVQEGQSSTYQQTEHFQNGIYSYSADGGAPEQVEGFSAYDMLDYCVGFLGENLLNLGYISAATVSETSGTLFLELDCTEECGKWLCEYACNSIFQDSTLLDQLSTAYAMNTCSAYMAIDKYTGMPTAVGLLYDAVHTIDGADYILNLQANQSFCLASQTAYETVTGEPLPEEEPETKPTPLFYRVTGADGQEMYLLGTIHIGDERTAYLPQALYDALDASDALAVEVDTIAFEEASTQDPNMAAQLLSLYLYTDGTTTGAHLDEAVYQDAIRLLKASGNYTAYAELMKPAVWKSSIENFFIQQGYGLSAGKGVDVRLLKIAKEKDMKILEIESGIAQMELLTGYSDEIQEFLLRETVACTAAEYYAAVSELFELWCQGDEAALREAVLDDTSEMTEAEMSLYDQYNQAMTIDRNDAMLDVAIDYLESGETVFYAVGLAHLLAENGLVDTLQDAGYTVELVTYN